MAGERPNINEPKDGELGPLPRDPNTAVALAIFYTHLGGFLSIGTNGRHYFGRPSPSVLDELPQLKGIEPDERFHSRDEWRGAMKFLEALLRRLDLADAELVFGLMASVAVDERKFVPSIEEPRRARPC